MSRRPCTTTASPRCRDSAQCWASPRQAVTEYHWVGPSLHDPSRERRRGVHATRKPATGVSPASRSRTSPPTRPCRVTVVSLYMSFSSPRLPVSAHIGHGTSQGGPTDSPVRGGRALG